MQRVGRKQTDSQDLLVCPRNPVAAETVAASSAELNMCIDGSSHVGMDTSHAIEIRITSIEAV